jgi:hypothetical protein
MVGQRVLFSIQNQQQAMRLIAFCQIGPTKGLWLAITCYNLNPVTSGHYSPNSSIIQKSGQMVGKRVSFSIQDQQQAMILISSMKGE